MNASHGLVLISGRSGSGKTTTAYVCWNELAQAKDKVIFTIEDPIGTYIPGVNQLEVDLDDERAYREAFSAVFDSDVDVLFIFHHCISSSPDDVANRAECCRVGTPGLCADGSRFCRGRD